jgi:hypothetical protein
MEATDKILDSHLPEVFTAASPHGHLLRRLLFFANDQLKRQLLQAMFPYFIGYFLISQIGLNANTGALKAGRDIARVVSLAFRYVEYDNLYR